MIVLSTVVLTASAYAMGDLTGQDAPSLDRREVIAADGTLGGWIDIDNFLGKVVLINFWDDG